MVDVFKRASIEFVSGEKGFFFSLDAILALSIVFAIIGGIGLYYTLTPELHYSSLQSDAEDLMTVLSTARVDEMGELKNKSYVEKQDYNKTVLELVGSLWTSGNKTQARDVVDTTIGNLTSKCWELDFADEKIRSNCPSNGDTVSVANRMASGYKKTERSEGYVTRGYISGADTKVEKSYIFFGGYVGDGNVTKNITLENLDTVLNASMELSAGGNFSLYINGNFSGNYSPSPGNMTADVWVLDEYKQENLKDGENTLQFNFTGNLSYISGGFFKVTYNTTGFKYATGPNTTRYKFPRIDGIINLYSSFYVPSDIQNITAHLHYMSNYTIFLKLGNATIYEDSTLEGEEKSVTLSDSYISSNLSSSGLSYSDISRRTVPLRLGTRNISYVIKNRKLADVFSVTDISGSMGDCNIPSNSSDYDCTGGNCIGASGWCDWSEGWCNWCGGTWETGYFLEKITVAKRSNYDFIDIVLNTTGNRAGLVGYETDVQDPDCHDLSEDNVSLKNKVDDWTAYGSTCICCGVNEAVDRLDIQSSGDRFRSMVVMSDGQANEDCPGRQGTGSAEQDAIEAACDAYQNHDVRVYTIGFGENVDESTLRDMANCGHGEYYYANVTELEDVYRIVTGQILNASYEAQTVKIHGGNVSSVSLFQDSYLLFNHSGRNQRLEYGEIPLTFESERFGGNISSPQKGWFWVTESSKVLDAKATSYSDEYWTALLNISNSLGNFNVYNISRYGDDYEKLGDPYHVQIPVENISEGNNTVYMDTAYKPGNYTGGSPKNRIIYKLGVRGSVGYGESFTKYEGGNVTIDTETGKSYVLSVGNYTDPWDPDKDALDDMIVRLIDRLDVNDDGEIGIEFTQDNLEIKEVRVEQVPFLWGPSMFTLKIW